MKTKARTKRKKTRRSGGNRLACVLLCLIALTAALGAEKPKKPYAVVAGTVFREPGFALPGAEVTLDVNPSKPKSKPMKAVSDSRGEFAFRVPAQEARYIVKVRAKGFEPQEKEASVSGEQRLDVFFQLKPLAP